MRMKNGKFLHNVARLKELSSYLGQQGAPDWAGKELEAAKEHGITDGTLPMQFIPRYQAAIMADRAVKAAVREYQEQLDQLQRSIQGLQNKV